MGLFRLIIQVFKGRSAAELQEAAVNKLSDTKLIRELAKTCAGFYVEGKGNFQDLKTKVGDFDKFKSVTELREAAVDKLSDTTLIRQLAKTCASFYVVGKGNVQDLKTKVSAFDKAKQITELSKLIREMEKKIRQK